VDDDDDDDDDDNGAGGGGCHGDGGERPLLTCAIKYFLLTSCLLKDINNSVMI